MSSSEPFVPSSPVLSFSPATHRRKSRFTFRHLSQLAQFSPTCPLRVIAHIDLDAFYAQCEAVRLGVGEDQPLAVQQWQGLIAINYPARQFGLSRHVNVEEARRLCPELIMQHVATWREGDEKWAYHADAFQHISTHKVSLDPYRLQSRKILATIKDVLPPSPMQRVEKASVDEVFLDLSAHVHSLLLQRYPELSGPAPYDDPAENLPYPPTSVLNWTTDALVDLDGSETEDDDPDWDDIAMLLGSEIVRSVRASIRDRLKYTCSAGIAQNKMLSKLGSGHKKPNQQTIVRNRAVQQFLASFKFTKIRNLGGKLGDEIVATFGVDTVDALLKVPQSQLQVKLGDDTGSWVYQIIRGIDFSEINSRTQIKSMLSAKSFRPSINTFEQGVKWLRIFVADIFSRLVEEGVLENRRRPRIINLHHRQGGKTISRQGPIPQGKALNEEMLFDMSKHLLSQVIAEGRAWPCANLSLSVGGFEDGIVGNRGIGAFLVKGEEAKAVNTNLQANATTLADVQVRQKRRRSESSGIHKFLGRRPDTRGRQDDGDGNKADDTREQMEKQAASNIVDGEENEEEEKEEDEEKHEQKDDRASGSSARGGGLRREYEHGGSATYSEPQQRQQQPRTIAFETADENPEKISSHHGSIDPRFHCPQCKAVMDISGRIAHEDWHFATDLQEEEDAAFKRNEDLFKPNSMQSSLASHAASAKANVEPKKHPTTSGKARVGSSKPEKGQSKLAFGK
ncbi:MAG: DNA-directed DNA polymerase eta rad30 [Piccolia ochrophora]|nr:MAG: DNA-directed DNA polymerase eta rad30 [Piccolia ochrophora]